VDVTGLSRLDRWAPWWGLVVVPGAFIALLSAAYAVVPLACRTQVHALVHVAPATELAICILGVLLSVRALRQARRIQQPASDRRFLAAISLSIALLFLAATLVQWYVAIMLSPCVQ
jgi:hypothetical protein